MRFNCFVMLRVSLENDILDKGRNTGLTQEGISPKSTFLENPNQIIRLRYHALDLAK